MLAQRVPPARAARCRRNARWWKGIIPRHEGSAKPYRRAAPAASAGEHSGICGSVDFKLDGQRDD